MNWPISLGGGKMIILQLLPHYFVINAKIVSAKHSGETTEPICSNHWLLELCIWMKSQLTFSTLQQQYTKQQETAASVFSLMIKINLTYPMLQFHSWTKACECSQPVEDHLVFPLKFKHEDHKSENTSVTCAWHQEHPRSAHQSRALTCSAFQKQLRW